MARIGGVDLPKNKRVDVGLTHIFGIGRATAIRLLAGEGIDPAKRVKDLTDDEVQALRKAIESYKIEGALRTEINQNIKRLVDIGCYRGLRHKQGLPVRGQRTRSNARTRKGPRGNMFKKTKKR
jgi:small subunit ribosomal protein S13